MVRLTGLQIMAIVEIDKLVNELKMVNDQVMEKEVQKEHDIKNLREKQTNLIEQIENWTRTLNESITDVH